MFRIAPKLVGVGRMAFTHELLPPMLMDAASVVGRHADVSDQAQAVQQLADVVRLGRDGHGLELGEWRQADRRVNDKQPIKLGQMFSRQPSYHGVGCPLTGTRPARDGDALDHGRTG